MPELVNNVSSCMCKMYSTDCMCHGEEYFYGPCAGSCCSANAPICSYDGDVTCVRDLIQVCPMNGFIQICSTDNSYKTYNMIISSLPSNLGNNLSTFLNSNYSKTVFLNDNNFSLSYKNIRNNCTSNKVELCASVGNLYQGSLTTFDTHIKGKEFWYKPI